jgi:hypothetical protein
MASFSADVIIYGNSMAALLAAKAISARGRTCYIVNEDTYVGGMTRGGLAAIDFGPNGSKASIIGGYTRSAFLDRLDVAYSRAVGTLMINPEPKTITSVVTGQLVTGAGITSHSAKPIKSVAKSNGKITSITCSADTYTGAVFLDTSYTGDLMALAGVSCTFGRESKNTYGEVDSDATSGGAIGFQSGAQPWTYGVLDSNGQRLYGSGPIPRSDLPVNSAYFSTSAFNFRVTLTNTASKKVAFTAPSGYSASNYTMLKNYLTATPAITKLVGTVGSTDGILGGASLYCGASPSYAKWECNTNAAVSSNLLQAAFGHPNLSWAYVNGSTATRTSIATEVYKWIAGLLYFCANDASLSGTAVQTDAQQYGYCNDEFASNWFGQQYFPSTLYVREARRLVGQYVMTENDVRAGATKSDPICRFNYPVDQHPHQRSALAVDVTRAQVEGGYNRPAPTSAYDIPWRCLLPCPGQADNLIVPWAVSCSHIAWGALRLELNGMMQGEAAGTAACLSIDGGVDPVRLPYTTLRPALLAQGALI